MKKLLIAMSAAAMFSLCAKAEKTLEGFMDFSAYTPNQDSTPVKVVPGASDPGLDQNYVFWAGDAGESEVIINEKEMYLKVDTPTAPLVYQKTYFLQKLICNTSFATRP